MRKKYKCPRHYQKQMDDYTEYLRRHGLRLTSIRTYRSCLNRVLHNFYSRNIRSLADVKPTDIYAAFESCGSKLVFTTPVRSFFRYLYKTGLHSLNLSPMVPAVRHFKPVPSVYTRTETEKMLSAINRRTLSGARSYAAILLALRLGLRGGDISNLKVNDIDFDAKTIEFVQGKTLVAQKLELLPEIAGALSEYLAIRENPTDSPYVFLSLIAPYGAPIGNFTGRSVAEHLKIAGIESGYRKRGSHAMRSTLASELASESVPYGVIQRILGQDSPESVKHYIKLDINMLRKCALDAPEPTGMLAEKLFAGGTVS